MNVPHVSVDGHEHFWPVLTYNDWKDTCSTLHMWTQVVGKIKLALSPMVNHWWQVPLYVSPRGLATGPIPYGHRIFEITFDFIGHILHVASSDGRTITIPLEPRSVADFYGELIGSLRAIDIDVKIWTTPCEIPDPIPFEQDHLHASYDPEYANRFWRVLVQASRVMNDFRARFAGKVSPVHFFWGSFDLAVTRFSGRPAPRHPGAPNIADVVTVEAYSHEVSSCGFWPGGPGADSPIFYAYAYPEPEGFRDYPVRPATAFYSDQMREFLLPYGAVRASSAPDDTLMEFLQSTYEAEAVLAKWDRAALERTE
jgi:hypothetical protein